VGFTTRAVDAAVDRIQFAVRLALALAVALLSVPLLSWSPAFADDAEAAAAAEVAVAETAAPEAVAPEVDAAEAPEPAPAEPAAEPAAEPDVEPAAEPAAAEPDAESTPDDAAGAGESVVAQAQAVAALETNPCQQPQPAVDTFMQYTNFDIDGPGDWINGNVNTNKGNLREGDFVWQRLVLTAVPAGTNSFTVDYQYNYGDNTGDGVPQYAYDFLDEWTVDGAAPVGVSAPGAGSDAGKRRVTMTWSQPSGDTTATILFGAHIASEFDWGPGNGAASISGSPFHVILHQLNCAGVGAQDNQIKLEAVPAGSLTIVKDAVPDSPQDFTFNLSREGDSRDFLLDDDADATLSSSTTFMTLNAGVPLTLREKDVPAPWTLTDLACVNTSSKAAAISVDEAAGTATITLADDSAVTCTFTNKQTADLEVDKFWVINGGAPVPEGAEPAHLGLGAQLRVNGQDRPWNTSVDGFLQGAAISLDEVVTFGNALCGWAGPVHGRVTEANGQAPQDGALPFATTLGGGHNHYTITNAVTCRSSLTVQKVVDNGPAAAGAWTVSATPVDPSHLAGPSAAGSAGGTVTADSPYLLAESGGDSRYVQHGPWTCTPYGDVVTVDGQQRVSVAAGRSATCTVHNATANLVLEKVVDNNDGGRLTASSFELYADPGTPSDATDDLSVTGAGSFWVNPGTTFRLYETGLGRGPIPAGYTQVSIVCDDGDAADAVQVAADTATRCTFTNADMPGSLTLQKIVDDDGTGDDTPATAWTLSATASPAIPGQAPVTGAGTASGAAKAGRYVLTETGPLTHTAGSWDCSVSGTTVDVPVVQVDVDQDGDPEPTVQVGLAQAVTCTIVNTAIAPTLTLEKLVTDPAGTGADLADDTEWTLSADGPADADLVGAEGDAAVTDVTVPVGAFTLGEADGPSGYAQVGWVCTAEGDDANLATGNLVEVSVAQDVTCVVENAAVPSTFDVGKTSDPADGSTVSEGDVIEYTISATNNGEGVAVTGVVVYDDLAGVLGSPVTVDADSVDGPLGSLDLASLDALVSYDQANNRLVWYVGTLAGEEQMTYAVTVGAADGATLRNHVTSPGSQNCPRDPKVEDPDCTTVHHTPEWTLDKSSEFDDADGDGFVEPGQTISYTLTATNTSANADAEVLVEDDLTDVLEHATLDLPLAAGLTFDPETGILTWAGGMLAPGDPPATVSYSLTVDTAAEDPDVWSQDLVNAATPESPGGACIEGEDDECSTTETTPPVTELTLEKKVTDPEHTGVALAADTAWTLSADGPGEADLEGAEGDDAVTDVTVPEGTFTLAEGGGPDGYRQVGWACRAGHDQTDLAHESQGTWTVTLAQGQDVTCVVENAAVPSTWELSKSASTSDPTTADPTVVPGEVISYTITVTRTGDGVNLLDVRVDDDLSDVLDDAAGGTVAEITTSHGSATLDGNVLEWDINEEVSDTATLTYTVTVAEDAVGATLRNHVTSPGSENCPPDPATEDPDCTTVHHTPAWTLDKEASFDDADGDGFVEPGQTVTYTLTATNASADAAAEIVVEDDLTAVLAWADGPDWATELDDELSFTDPVLTWTPGTLEPGVGNAFTVSYTVTVDTAEANPDIWAQVLHNVATPESPGGSCVPGPGLEHQGGESAECETETETPPVTTIIAEKRALEGDALLDGAVIEVWDDVDNPGDNATGACVVPDDPAVDEANDVLVGTITTGADDPQGQAWFADLQRGCYLVVEAQPPAGYELPEQTTQFVAINDESLAGPVTVLFQDLAQGQLSAVAKQQLELVDGAWVPSDGVIGFGEQVKYVVQVRATGLKTFHGVTVTDYVPGFNPEDTTSTMQGALVPGSATCTGDIACAVTVSAGNLVTWAVTGSSTEEIAEGVIRNQAIDGVTEGAVEMVVTFPPAPDPLPVDPGESYTATLWNVAFLDYDEVVGLLPVSDLEGVARGMAKAAAPFEMQHHRLASNEVTIHASTTLPPGGILPPPAPPEGGTTVTGGVLPATGADAHLLQLMLLGGLALATGAAMIMRSRRRDQTTA
jgi:fimbrial isopeptide formation D2 family protein/uncharacterized repeat protein (TIGR01451 family)/LPXTG-motif cell wall-anchored protein